MNKVKLCKFCKKHGTFRESKGYTNAWANDVYICPDCKHPMVDVDYPSKDFDIIKQISYEPSFIEAMITLRKNNPVEYQIKLAEIKTNAQQHKQEQSNNKQVMCPYCKSINTKKISTTSKAVNTAMFGLLGTKRHKQWHCNNCNSDF